MQPRMVYDFVIAEPAATLLGNCRAIVAIPARDEADRIRRCLSAFAVQHDRVGAPIAAGDFGVLLLVNNSTDGTAQIARELAASIPYPLEVLQLKLTQNATAGGARRRAMQEARIRIGAASDERFLMTTDADSIVTPSWFADNVAHLTAGADCVAGYIDAEPAEIVSHGPAFLARGRLEDAYIRLTAEIHALCDPRPHDPWPNHRVSSGASLAVKVGPYDAVGGMPNQPLGEDGAFTALLDRNGFKVRHALDVSVSTSCRLDGRASGGAADTMRLRRDMPNAPCDAELEPALATLRRACYRGFLRKSFEKGTAQAALNRLLETDDYRADTFLTFADLWEQVENRHPKLQRGEPLRPSDLPRELAAANFILRHLRPESASAQAGRSPRAAAPAPVDA
jgi:hypothetical protein